MDSAIAKYFPSSFVAKGFVNAVSTAIVVIEVQQTNYCLD